MDDCITRIVFVFLNLFYYSATVIKRHNRLVFMAYLMQFKNAEILQDFKEIAITFEPSRIG